MFFFFFNDTATTEIYTLSLHDALPILLSLNTATVREKWNLRQMIGGCARHRIRGISPWRDKLAEVGAKEAAKRSEEHTSELQSRQYLVCRLLLEKKKVKLLEADYVLSI